MYDRVFRLLTAQMLIDNAFVFLAVLEREAKPYLALQYDVDLGGNVLLRLIRRQVVFDHATLRKVPVV